MNAKHFVVRQHRRVVVKTYSELIASSEVAEEELDELGHTLAGLPAELESDCGETKRRQ